MSRRSAATRRHGEVDGPRQSGERQLDDGAGPTLGVPEVAVGLVRRSVGRG